MRFDTEPEVLGKRLFYVPIAVRTEMKVADVSDSNGILGHDLALGHDVDHRLWGSCANPAK